ncbi:MAG: alpha-xylosidase [Bacillota bacterium]|nr:alpha-xylosidase [Bacillota bacterium]
MKFTDGFWLNREGINIYNAAKVYDMETDKDSITVYAPHLNVQDRGQTLMGPLLTVRFSSPMPDVICVQVYHYKGKADRGPRFDVQKDENIKVKIENNQDYALLKSGNLNVKIGKRDNWRIDFCDNDRPLTNSGWKNMGYVLAGENGAFMKEQLSLGVGECVYGLGERFTPFVKNGQVVDIWNADGGTSSELAYKNIPFYVTNKGYGVFVNDPGCVSFEVASEKVSRVQFSAPGEYLEYYIINGPTIKAVLERYTTLTGKPALPPAWSFGLWLTTSFTTNYDENTVTEFIDGMAKRDLPLHVFHFDCFWMKDYSWCNFEWDERVFPDPENMLKRLKNKGLKICVWINPYIAQRSSMFDEGMKNGYLLKNKNGDVWQCDAWQPGMGIVDFTNPDACIWFADKLARLIDMGVDCFKTDFGERIPIDGVYFDGSDPVKMHNYYTYLYNRVVFEVLNEKLGNSKAMVFARSATVGGQKFPVHWGGDCTANYESMAESLRGGLSLCMSGFGFWSHDISGFEQTATPDVYKRWTAFGLLSSHSRLHGNGSYRVPWLFDEEAVDVLRFFTKLKCSIMPYLFGAACIAAKSGIPVMRAMVTEFMDDPTCDYLDRQYMLGDSLLVAPIFREDGNVTYYLPKGIWTNFITGEKCEGGRWINEDHSYISIPLLVRPNSIIAVGSIDSRPDYDFADGVTLHVFELQDGGETSAVVYNTVGQEELEVTIKRHGDKLTVIKAGIGKPCHILLRGIKNVKSSECYKAINDEKGVIVSPIKDMSSFEITYND